MGWSRNGYEWDTDQATDAADMIAAGCRTAYYPANWQWTFLRPQFSFSTADGQREYPLPDFFAHLVGRLTFDENAAAVADITIVSDSMIRQRYQDLSVVTTGYPMEAAVRTLPPTADRSSRSVLAVWPEPDGPYTIHGQCAVQPDTVTQDMPYPYGPPAFHECLLNAILMHMERKLGENTGAYAQAFAQSLASAQRQDAEAQPATLGMNRDRERYPIWLSREARSGDVSYSGY